MTRRAGKGKPPWKRFHSDTELEQSDLQKSCLNKKQLTVTEAQRIVQTARREGTQLAWYECEHCQKVHMTSK